MLYKGKAIEIVGEKEVFGQRITWIRLFEDDSFLQVPFEELESVSTNYTISNV
jgi:hypothetical protein